MGASRTPIPPPIPQWEDQNLYELLYPRDSLFTDIQGVGRFRGSSEPLLDQDGVINLYQDHLARAIDISDLMTANVIFWTSAPMPVEYRRGYPIWANWGDISPGLDPFQTYILDRWDGQCHVTRIPTRDYLFQGSYVSRSVVLCLDQQLQQVGFASTRGYQHHLGITQGCLRLDEPTRVLNIGRKVHLQPFQDNLSRFFNNLEHGNRPARFRGRFRMEQ